MQPSSWSKAPRHGLERGIGNANDAHPNTGLNGLSNVIRGNERGGWVSSLARRRRTLRRCSFDARSRRRLNHRSQRIERFQQIKIERRQAACKLVAFNASPRSMSCASSYCPINLECLHFRPRSHIETGSATSLSLTRLGIRTSIFAQFLRGFFALGRFSCCSRRSSTQRPKSRTVLWDR